MCSSVRLVHFWTLYELDVVNPSHDRCHASKQLAAIPQHILFALTQIDKHASDHVESVADAGKGSSSVGGSSHSGQYCTTYSNVLYYYSE